MCVCLYGYYCTLIYTNIFNIYRISISYIYSEIFYINIPLPYTGGGGDLAAPTDAAIMITKWKKEGLEGFKNSLLRANFRKYSAYSVFAFLILLVLDLIVESGSNAFVV